MFHQTGIHICSLHHCSTKFWMPIIANIPDKNLIYTSNLTFSILLSVGCQFWSRYQRFVWAYLWWQTHAHRSPERQELPRYSCRRGSARTLGFNIIFSKIIITIHQCWHEKKSCVRCTRVERARGGEIIRMKWPLIIEVTTN